MENKTNTLAIISFIASLLFFIPLTGIAGFIMGIISLSQINESGERGRGMAITSIVLGALSLMFWFFAVIGSAI
jgi:hypothetical protein